MDNFLLHLLGQRSVFGKHVLSIVCWTSPNSTLVTFFKICPTSGKLERRERDNANSSTVAKEPKDPISLLILVPSTALIHVDSHTDLIFVLGRNKACAGARKIQGWGTASCLTFSLVKGSLVVRPDSDLTGT
jgi:hypothetical protein